MSKRKAAKVLGVAESTLRENRAKHAREPRTDGGAFCPCVALSV
jgi:hypothetical protein